MQMDNIRHSGIVVKNIERATKFYQKYFNFIIVKKMNESGDFIDKVLGYQNLTVKTVKMKTGSSMLELLEFKNPKSENKDRKINDYGCTHIAITVSDLDKLFKQLKKEGVHFISAPQISEDGAAKVCFCRDHDGTFLELVEEIK